MKQFIAAAVLALATTGAIAQENAIEKYFSQHKANTEFTQMSITGKMFELTMHIEANTPEEQELLDALSLIEGAAFIGSDSIPNSATAYAQAVQTPGKEFEELMNVKNGEVEATFMIRESNGVVEELLVIVGGKKEFGIGCIWGEIDLAQMSEMLQKIDMAGMDMFDEKAIEYKSAVNYYPNPVGAGQTGTLIIPENMKGIQMRVYDLSGKEVMNQQINDLQTTVALNTLSVGTYVMNLYDGSTRFYTERIVIAK